MSSATTLEPGRPSSFRHQPPSVVMQWTFTLLMNGLLRPFIRTLEATGRAERFLSSIAVQGRKRAQGSGVIVGAVESLAIVGADAPAWIATLVGGALTGMGVGLAGSRERWGKARANGPGRLIRP